MKTLDRVEAAFPGGFEPAFVAIAAPDVKAAPVADAVSALRERIAADPHDFGRGQSYRVARNGRVAELTVPLAGDGTDSRSQDALAKLRDQLIPATVGAVPGAQAQVTGSTAGSVDFNDLLAERVPWVFAFVLGMAFLLLLVSFRSLVIPLTAIGLNLLSVGAAYGIVVWIFQDGHLEGLLDFHSVGTITAWLPLFLFVVLFGLSMDYHVFILTRIREAYDRGMSTEAAVSHGLRTTAGVVTSAAAVMVAVFAIFADPLLPRLQGDGDRAGGGDPDRRDDHPRRAPAGDDEAARRAQLVPAAVAGVAAAGGPRAGLLRAREAASYPPYAAGRGRGGARLTRLLALMPPWAVGLWRLLPRVPAQVGGGVALLNFAIWALTGAGDFWFLWVWLAVWLVLALIVAWRWSRLAPPGPRRNLETLGAFATVLSINAIFNWAIGGGGYFWPIWVILGFGVAFAVYFVYLRNRGADLRAGP